MEKITNYKDLEAKLTMLGHTESMVQATVSAVATIDKYDLSEDEKYAIYTLLSSSGLEALKSLPEAVAQGQWGEFDYGNVALGDYVRVKKNAYTSESGVNHNGKVGRLARMHAGKCVVHYIGLDTGDNMTHPVSNLESLKMV